MNPVCLSIYLCPLISLLGVYSCQHTDPAQALLNLYLSISLLKISNEICILILISKLFKHVEI